MMARLSSRKNCLVFKYCDTQNGECQTGARGHPMLTGTLYIILSSFSIRSTFFFLWICSQPYADRARMQTQSGLLHLHVFPVLPQVMVIHKR
ncbi:hypothetical protein BV25DRAFT_1825339 [Artomyces pyxidatus]|uniref:Uncharacterized protein n=1 Tax=Artomyces pyxidatus TaxID=48021 RepID=A0ACB8T256_9AGAM|nr:hypothetical protein BV25DRAFT_1825339 [Artomyces pyxidatus]